jgi:hypothetical protein
MAISAAITGCSSGFGKQLAIAPAVQEAFGLTEFATLAGHHD